MSVLMVGVDESTKGGMWTVVENYLNDFEFVKKNDLIYIPTSITGCTLLNKLLFTAKAYMQIMQLYKKKNIDILHVHMSERASVNRKHIVMKYAKSRGSKIVLHMHGAEFEVVYKQLSEKKRKHVRDTLNIADEILILGEYWREFIGELVEDSSKIHVVYNAVKVPKEYSYNNDGNEIIFLGAVSKRKGIDILLQALEKIKNELSGGIIVNIFGPDVEGNIETKITNFGLQEWVRYKGFLTKEHKGDVLKNTLINVLPSYNEGLPMTILEAMSYGIPSITTSIAAIPEAVNESNGILIEPGNVDALASAIINMVRNREQRLILSRNAYNDANVKFSVQKHIETIQEIYNKFN